MFAGINSTFLVLLLPTRVRATKHQHILISPKALYFRLSRLR
jgi:hypothetical protein